MLLYAEGENAEDKNNHDAKESCTHDAPSKKHRVVPTTANIHTIAAAGGIPTPISIIPNYNGGRLVVARVAGPGNAIKRLGARIAFPTSTTTERLIGDFIKNVFLAVVEIRISRETICRCQRKHYAQSCFSSHGPSLP